MSNQSIMVKHVLKNAFVPLAQYIPASLLLTLGPMYRRVHSA